MLVGSLKVKDKEQLHSYSIKASDTSSSFYGIINTFSDNAIYFIDDTKEGNGLPTRRFNIKLSSVSIETVPYFKNARNEELDKESPRPVNYDFWCKFGALVRYIKSRCTSKNEVGYTGLAYATKDFIPETTVKYIVPLGTTGSSAEVVCYLNELRKLKFNFNGIELDIEENDEIPDEIFYKFSSCSISRGFKFDKEYLGFEVPKIKAPPPVGGVYTDLNDIIANNPDMEFEWLLDKNYYIVDDATLEDVIEKFRKHNGYVYYDTETTGLDITFLSRVGRGDQLVGVVLSMLDGESYFFPTQMNTIPNLCNGDHNYFMQKYMKPILETKQLVAHNMSFDLKVAYIYDIIPNIVHDTQALIKLTLGAEHEDFPLKLKLLTRLLLKRDALDLSHAVVEDKWGESDVVFSDLPYEFVRLYANGDTDNTRGILKYVLDNDLLSIYNATKTYEIEINFSYAVAYQEFYGHRADVDKLKDLRVDIQKGQDKYMQLMKDLVGYDFNPNSSQQLQRFMYNPLELNIPPQYKKDDGKSKKKALTTDKDTLRYLSELTDIEGNIKYPFVVYLQKYREYEGIRKIIDKFPTTCTKEGFLFSSVYQYGTTTGRVSIHEPNYQSYNDAIKKYIVPRLGFGMTDCDYSSIEYRILGSMANNIKIKKGFEDPDFDYHAYQAARMFNVAYSAVTKVLRKSAKGINFGLPYGMGDKSLGINIFGEESQQNTLKARKLREKYFDGQEDILIFFETARENGVKLGYTETFFGRRRYYNKTKFSVHAIRRQSGNQVIQGTAADIYKMAVGNLFKRICREGLFGKVLFSGFIHDELLSEIHESVNPLRWLKMLREEFEVKVEGWCPLYMGFGFGRNWYEAKSVELPIKMQWELVDLYDSGKFVWDNNFVGLCDRIPGMIRDFTIRDIKKQLLDKESQATIIKPTLNNQLLDIIKEDMGILVKAKANKTYSKVIYLDNDISESLADKPLVSTFGTVLKKPINIDDVTIDTFKDTIKSVKLTEDTQDIISMFCTLHNFDRSAINILNIPDVNANIEETNASSAVFYKEFFDYEDTEIAKQVRKDKKIDILGLHVDIETKEATLRVLDNKKYMELIRNKLTEDANGYKVFLKDLQNQKLYTTNLYLPRNKVESVQHIYLSYERILGVNSKELQLK